VAPGSSALAQIADRWPQVVRNGVLDRKALGAIVFSSEEERRALEAILHPWIREEALRRMDDWLARGAERVIYDAPLLFETGADAHVDAVILVAAPEEAQRERLMRRDGLDAAQAVWDYNLAKARFLRTLGRPELPPLPDPIREYIDSWEELE